MPHCFSSVARSESVERSESVRKISCCACSVQCVLRQSRYRSTDPPLAGQIYPQREKRVLSMPHCFSSVARSASVERSESVRKISCCACSVQCVLRQSRYRSTDPPLAGQICPQREKRVLSMPHCFSSVARSASVERSESVKKYHAALAVNLSTNKML